MTPRPARAQSRWRRLCQWAIRGVVRGLDWLAEEER